MLDTHGDDWKQWLVENAERGCSVKRMFADMIKSGVWTEAQAAGALEVLFGEKGLKLSGLPTIPAQLDFEIEGAKIHISARLNSPHVCLIDGLLSEDECDQLLNLIDGREFEVSGVVDANTGQSVLHNARTSTSTYFERGGHPLIAKLESRLSKLTNWPITHAEGLQLLQYEIGQQYKAHVDWFGTEHVGSAKHLERGGERVATTIIYLVTPAKGGATSFPKAGLSVFPRRGSAVFFRNLTVALEPDEMTLHAGEPVEEGTKIILTYWQREGEFA